MRYFERLARGETPATDEWNEYLKAFHSLYENVTSGPCSVLRTVGGETSYQLLTRRACEAVPQAKTILDIGCGDGLLLRRVRTQFPEAELVGIDLSEDEIARARSLFDGATFLCGDAHDVDLGIKRFDLALLHLALSAFSRPESILQAARSALRDNGALVMVTERTPAHRSLAVVVEAVFAVLREMHSRFTPFFPGGAAFNESEALASMLRTAGFAGSIESEDLAVRARLTRREMWGVAQRLYPFGLIGDKEQERVRAAVEERVWRPDGDGRIEITVNIRIVVAK